MKDLLNKNYIEKETNYNCIILEEIDSTNHYAKKIETSENLVIIADKQTKGRGRLGRDFISKKGKGIYMSIVLTNFNNLIDITKITCLMAVVVSTVLDELTDLKTKIKWVNDIYISDKKVCGILVESIIKNNQVDKVIIGIGINVYKQNFPIELKSKVTSLEENTDILLERNKIIIAILNKLDEEFQNFSTNHFMKEYKKRSNLIGRIVQIRERDNSYEGKVLDINEEGNLIVETSLGIRTLYSGEVERIIL